jgi:hypothetical protein
MRRRWPALLAGLVAFLLPTYLHATPANKKSLENYLGPFAKRAIDCRVCHLPDSAGNKISLDETDKPHNVFGARLKAVRKELARAGKPNDLESRLAFIANEDSDGDGISNLVELLTGHFPGDPTDKPTAEELKDIGARLAEFSKYQGRYRWKPFEPVTRPAPPDLSGFDGLDAFIESARRDQGLQARPEAPKDVLLRRVYLDLIGLPPTREERSAFLNDPSQNAYEKLVDRLLASPWHAERWARHWMDVWRYSDWAGYGMEVRESQPHIWHWRDWIIDSLQADKGYDQMVREMLAGDEIAPNDPNTVRATGFLVRNWFRFNRNVWLDQTVEHTSKAFLGVTLNCARCHDHMYDPFRQDEYYSFRAFFEPHQIRTDRLPGQPSTEIDGLPRVYDADLAAKTYLLIRGNEAHPDKDQLCAAGVPKALKGPTLQISTVSLPRDAYDVEGREYVLQERVKKVTTRIRNGENSLRDARLTATSRVVGMIVPAGSAWLNIPGLWLKQQEIELDRTNLLVGQLELIQAQEALSQRKQHHNDDHSSEPSQLLQMQLVQRQRAAAEARRDLHQAEFNLYLVKGKQNQQVQRDKIKSASMALKQAEETLVKPLDPAWQPAPAKYLATSTGRRRALATWITDSRNPLTARVAVNHIWLRHFGQPLVPTVFDFGKNGQPPSSPALVDWLAAEFMQNAWSMKKLHKLIVMSKTYRMDSTPDSASLTRDPDNRWYWRRLPQRMEAELVRDSLLHLSGRLDFTRSGPDLDQNLGLTTNRRSLYYRHANEKQMVFLTTFDVAGPTECYRRVSSVVPQQALALANSSLSQESSSVIARKVAESLGPQAPASAFVVAIFEQILARTPTAQEETLCLRFLNEQENRAVPNSTATETATQRARTSLVHVLVNHHEFVTIR